MSVRNYFLACLGPKNRLSAFFFRSFYDGGRIDWTKIRGIYTYDREIVWRDPTVATVTATCAAAPATCTSRITDYLMGKIRGRNDSKMWKFNFFSK